MGANSNNGKSLESWIWDAACSIRGAKDAPKYKEFILPLIFAKRLCDVFDDEVNRIAKEVGSRAKAFKLVKHDKKLVRFFLPLEPKNPDEPVWSVIRTLADKIGEQLTTHLRAIADANPLLKGIIDRVDFNATTHGERDIDDDRLSNLIERSARSGSASATWSRTSSGAATSISSASSPRAAVRARASSTRRRRWASSWRASWIPSPAWILRPLLRLRRTAHQVRAGAWTGKMNLRSRKTYAPLSSTARNPPHHLGDGQHEHDHPRHGGRDRDRRHLPKPKFRKGNRLQTFDRVVANPMWNQTEFTEKDYDADELGRFPKGAGFPGNKADWGWVQHILASLNDNGRAAVVLDTGAASRGSGNANTNKEKDVRKWFVEQDLIEGVIYLPENLFYNTTAPGIILFLNKSKPKERQGKLFLLNASREFAKGDPKNYIPDEAILRIAETFKSWREEEKFSRIVTRAEIAKNDFNISPSRYIHTGETDEYRPISEIVEELEALEEQAVTTNVTLKNILQRITA